MRNHLFFFIFYDVFGDFHQNLAMKYTLTNFSFVGLFRRPSTSRLTTNDSSAMKCEMEKVHVIEDEKVNKLRSTSLQNGFLFSNFIFERADLFSSFWSLRI